jgi:hypothetical protein
VYWASRSETSLADERERKEQLVGEVKADRRVRSQAGLRFVACRPGYLFCAQPLGGRPRTLRSIACPEEYRE